MTDLRDFLVLVARVAAMVALALGVLIGAALALTEFGRFPGPHIANNSKIFLLGFAAMAACAFAAAPPLRRIQAMAFVFLFAIALEGGQNWLTSSRDGQLRDALLAGGAICASYTLMCGLDGALRLLVRLFPKRAQLLSQEIEARLRPDQSRL